MQAGRLGKVTEGASLMSPPLFFSCAFFLLPLPPHAREFAHSRSDQIHRCTIPVPFFPALPLFPPSFPALPFPSFPPFFCTLQGDLSDGGERD